MADGHYSGHGYQDRVLTLAEGIEQARLDALPRWRWLVRARFRREARTAREDASYWITRYDSQKTRS